ncbi:DUF5985 family protein [Noviherbaspirillum sp.]|uniref:DUF5985 family protein n=1 Tax=Noviherbaspirillum sp. TaxID=1926288 RepID=UPI002D496F94|nr:DUF5985 family protein [Noviherbaspirillum sp.]HZW20341.1 DUF5985 family protein [Noviherbaspirillum sp.]
MNTLNAVLAGAIAMASLTVSLFFFRFWRSTGDRFFLYFAMSFMLEGVNRIILCFTDMQSEDTFVYYTIRLAAYALILFAILEKNWYRRKEHA